MISITLPGEPIAKARPRFSRKGTYDPQSSLKHAAKFQVLSQINRTFLPYTSNTPIEIEMNFFFPIPKADKNIFRWGILNHINKPDIDNCIKWICDVMNGIVYEDDRQVFSLVSRKEYSENPRTEIYIVPKKPEVSDQVKEVLALIPPSEIASIADILSCIAHWSEFHENPFHVSDNGTIDYEEVAFLILDLAEKHADNLKKINKKFPGLAKILKERMEKK